MIIPEQLRIGNWVYNPAIRTNMQVYPMMIPRLHRIVSEGGQPNIEPIPLTPETLEKCGFEKGDYNEFRHTDLIGTLTLYDGICEIHLGDLYSVWIESLHRLQNLFYSLTGKELEVKL